MYIVHHILQHGNWIISSIINLILQESVFVSFIYYSTNTIYVTNLLDRDLPRTIDSYREILTCLLNQSHYQLNHLAKSTCWKIELDNPLMNWSKTTSITRFTSRTTLVMKMANWPALLVSSALISLPCACCLIIVHLTSNGKGFTVR